MSQRVEGRVRIGTRGSSLALIQARWVAGALEEAEGIPAELETVRTSGDRDSRMPLSRASEPGIFTAALDEALLEGRVELAVHSLKDLPTKLHPDLEMVAVPVREDPADVLVLPEGREGGLGSLPPGARVGSSSPRRQALCRAYRSDLRVEPIRGNVDTRLSKVDDGQFDAAVMASAGLRRMGLANRASGTFEVREWPPAPGQGALAVVARRGEPSPETPLHRALETLQCSATRAAVDAERQVLHELEAGCSVPVGAIGLPYRGRLRLWAMVLSEDGRRVVRTDATGDQRSARALGSRVAETLRNRGAMEILQEAGRIPDPEDPGSDRAGPSEAPASGGRAG